MHWSFHKLWRGASGHPMYLGNGKGKCGFWGMMGHRENLRDRGQKTNKQNHVGRDTNAQDSTNLFRRTRLPVGRCLWNTPLESCAGHKAQTCRSSTQYKVNVDQDYSSPPEPVQRWTFDELVLLAVSGVQKHVKLCDIFITELVFSWLILSFQIININWCQIYIQR